MVVEPSGRSQRNRELLANSLTLRWVAALWLSGGATLVPVEDITTSMFASNRGPDDLCADVRGDRTVVIRESVDCGAGRAGAHHSRRRARPRPTRFTVQAQQGERHGLRTRVDLLHPDLSDVLAIQGRRAGNVFTGVVTSEKTVPSLTYVGHYPPLYYLLVGTGSYLSEQKAGLYAMRLISAAMSAYMIAMCAYTIVRWSRRRTIAIGVFLAFTPLAYFLSSSVNPSGFEIATAICLWSAAVIFGLDYADDPPHGLIVVIAIAASVLILIRGLSPLWVILVALTIVALVGPRTIIDLARRRRDVQIALG